MPGLRQRDEVPKGRLQDEQTVTVSVWPHREGPPLLFPCELLISLPNENQIRICQMLKGGPND